MNDFSLSNKTAVITGGAGLLGMEHAEALLEMGCLVVLTDLSQERLSLAKKRLVKIYGDEKVHCQVVDVTQESDVKAASLAIKKLYGRVDILINNAAIDPKVSNDGRVEEASRLENFSLDQWDLQISVGLTGAFICAKVFGSMMAEDGNGGVILNIASDLAVIAPNQSLYSCDGLTPEQQPVKPVTYSVIKSGLLGLTRYLSTYWLDCNIRCNALSPGGIYNGQSDEFIERVSKLIPMGRMAKRNEYRGAVQFLCSDASSYMNGQNLVIDGGRSAW
jgi:NAD(P)-dependent dehydrogenase (short-subunit alcohol dehydrogenase family)